MVEMVKSRLSHLLRQPVDLSAGVAVDDGLRDGEGLVEIAQRCRASSLPSRWRRRTDGYLPE